jgi:hypothetical protein
LATPDQRLVPHPTVKRPHDRARDNKVRVKDKAAAIDVVVAAVAEAAVKAVKAGNRAIQTAPLTRP